MSYGDGTSEHKTGCTLSFARFSGLNLRLNNVFFLAIPSSPELFRCVTVVKAALLSLRRGRRRRRERQRGGAPPQGRSRSFSFRSTGSRGPRRRGQRPAFSFATLLSGHNIAAKKLKSVLGSRFYLINATACRRNHPCSKRHPIPASPFSGRAVPESPSRRRQSCQSHRPQCRAPQPLNLVGFTK